MNKPEDHHLFTLLDGNPQSIILVASLLGNHEKKMTLKEVYEMLADSDCADKLREEGIYESDKISRRVSNRISY